MGFVRIIHGRGRAKSRVLAAGMVGAGVAQAFAAAGNGVAAGPRPRTVNSMYCRLCSPCCSRFRLRSVRLRYPCHRDRVRYAGKPSRTEGPEGLRSWWRSPARELGPGADCAPRSGGARNDVDPGSDGRESGDWGWSAPPSGRTPQSVPPAKSREQAPTCSIASFALRMLQRSSLPPKIESGGYLFMILRPEHVGTKMGVDTRDFYPSSRFVEAPKPAANSALFGFHATAPAALDRRPWPQ